MTTTEGFMAGVEGQDDNSFNTANVVIATDASPDPQPVNQYPAPEQHLLNHLAPNSTSWIRL